MTAGGGYDILLVMKTYCRKALAAVSIVAWLLSAAGAIAAEQAEATDNQNQAPAQAQTSSAEDFGYGVGSVLASLFYSPFKVTYAGLGLLTGGVGYVLSAGNPDVANNIINPAIRGDYVVTPSNLKGEEPLIFVGPPPSSAPAQPAQASPVAPAQN